MKTRALHRLLQAALLGLAAACSAAHAGIIIIGTRVIYSGADTEAVVKLNNQGELPGLAQVWLDRGDPKAPPATVDVPFTVMPPVARLDPGRSQTLRILYTGEALPEDKESVFWLNMLEVPPKPARGSVEGSALMLAFRTRIKLFYRPTGLQGDPAKAPEQVTWRLLQENGKVALEASNPTPYHVTVADAMVKAGERQLTTATSEMIPPGESRRLPLLGDAAGAAANGGATVEYHAINDYGASVALQGKVQEARPGTSQPALNASR